MKWNTSEFHGETHRWRVALMTALVVGGVFFLFL